MNKIISFLFLCTTFTLSARSINQGHQASPWEIAVNSRNNYTGISLSSGRIGIMPSEKPFRAESIFLNTIYEKESEKGVSRLLKGINFANLAMVIDGDTVDEKSISDWQQTFNLKEASLTTSFRYRNKAAIEYTLYALRGMPYTGILDVSVKASENVNLSVAGILLCPQEYKDPDPSFRILKDNEIKMPLLQTVAKSQFGKHTLATTAAFLFSHEFPELKHRVISAYCHQLEFQKELLKGEAYHFAWCGAVCTTGDFWDPVNESERMTIFLMRGNKSKVIAQHRKLWEELWKGDIEIEGDLESQHDIRLALYHLYAFSRDDSRLSIAPMGLSSLNYNGHIFWDSELWMFPPLLAFNQGIARSLLDYRWDRLAKARQKAANFGYKGAMFPWESDDTGEEATPSWALTGTFEHHITADVGIAFWNYFRVTGDLHWLKETGFPVIKEVADFWVSRATKNKDNTWSLLNVVGADEFAPNVDDNAFTNGSAKAILSYAVEAARILGMEPDPEWKKMTENIRFHYFTDGVIREHSLYNGEIIKQADVNLLAYPLEIVTDKESVRKDLEYYETRIAEEGPAMSYSILSILYARLGDRDKAFDMFKKAYLPNKRPPFGALAESALSHNPYFATGAGGMLQVVLFGFGGLRITDKGIIQETSCLPRQWKKLTIKGIGPEKKEYTILH